MCCCWCLWLVANVFFFVVYRPYSLCCGYYGFSLELQQRHQRLPTTAVNINRNNNENYRQKQQQKSPKINIHHTNPWMTRLLQMLLPLLLLHQCVIAQKGNMWVSKCEWVCLAVVVVVFMVVLLSIRLCIFVSDRLSFSLMIPLPSVYFRGGCWFC